MQADPTNLISFDGYINQPNSPAMSNPFYDGIMADSDFLDMGGTMGGGRPTNGYLAEEPAGAIVRGKLPARGRGRGTMGRPATARAGTTSAAQLSRALGKRKAEFEAEFSGLEAERKLYNPSQMIRAILLMLTLGMEAQPVRFRDQYNQAETAMAGPFNTRQKVGWTAQPVILGATQISGADMLVFTHKTSPLHHFTFYDPNPNASAYTAAWQGSNGNGFAAPQGTIALVNGDGFLRVSWALATSTYKPHGAMLFAKIAPDGTRFILINVAGSGSGSPAPTVINITFTNAPNAQDALQSAIVLVAWQDGDPVEIAATGLTSGTRNYSFNLTAANSSTDYYAIQITNASPNLLGGGGGAAVTTNESCSMWCHRPVEQYFQNGVTAPYGRFLASGALQSDVASLLNAQGVVACAPLPPGTSWQSQALRVGNATNGATLTNVSNLRDSTLWGMVKGAYGFVRPINQQDFEMVQWLLTAFEAAIIFDINWNPLEPDSQSICFAMNTVPPTLVVNQVGGYGADTWLTAYAWLEYLTDNKWFALGYPMRSGDPWRMALEDLTGIHQFAENPEHFKQIWNAIKSFGGGAKEIALQTLKSLGPAAVAVIPKLYEHFSGNSAPSYSQQYSGTSQAASCSSLRKDIQLLKVLPINNHSEALNLPASIIQLNPLKPNPSPSSISETTESIENCDLAALSSLKARLLPSTRDLNAMVNSNHEKNKPSFMADTFFGYFLDS
jgi:hypothetical protein